MAEKKTQNTKDLSIPKKDFDKIVAGLLKVHPTKKSKKKSSKATG